MTIVDRGTFTALTLGTFTFYSTFGLRLIRVLLSCLFIFLVLVFVLFSIAAKLSLSTTFLLLFLSEL